ncbi:SDR family NAD(P)-dependent oxidoreductase [Phototrophicus methaneseepsis]|uniref:SDR family NAD(P)-dependent oxidoreductase n=1 Tax=Phototrophicus methaneseepsis TaxID=2710758 RepID=A0A7S8IDY6_9CHLR|nr:SDR family NAD(P)-dependent oxidoreductase [Phototrophicus methaneseepsis]QPC81854.1 SDR family NAD(P)-dependent oxidoreductase [Phototrophicus methaneseepsis]
MTKVVFITGASSGIGAAAALAFAKANCHVAGVARRLERLQSLQAQIDALPAPHGDFLPLAGDVTQAEEIQQAVAAALERFGKLDVIVVNAGLGHRGAVADAEWDDIETLLRTNIDGALHTIRAGVPALRANGSGHILTVSSVTFNMVSPYAATYGASKAFLSSLAASLRIELAADHILVTDFLVGRTETEFNEKRLGAGKRSSGGIPTMKPEQVADAMVRVVLKQPNKQRVILRFFDRLLVLGNTLIPGIIGQLAKRQYK